MDKVIPCRIEQCKNRVHARGYCHKHYGILYRRGKLDDAPTSLSAVVRLRTQTRDEVKHLKRQLDHTREAYQNAISLEARIFWSREVKLIEYKLGVINE